MTTTFLPPPQLRARSVERFPELGEKVDRLDEVDDRKATFFLAERCPAQLLLETPARAILVPHLTTNRSTVIEPVARRKAWHALLSSTLAFLPGSSRESAELFGSLSARLPAFLLMLGTDRDGVRSALENFLPTP